MRLLVQITVSIFFIVKIGCGKDIPAVSGKVGIVLLQGMFGQKDVRDGSPYSNRFIVYSLTKRNGYFL